MRALAAIFAVLTLVGHSRAGEDSTRSESPARRPPVPVVTVDPGTPIANPLDGTDVPLLAVWQDSPGHVFGTDGPYLRIAIWSDGRVVFAHDPSAWNHDLLIGQLTEQTVTKLKHDIRDSGVFDLKGYCYLVPDAPVDCVMISFDGLRQMLYWDEREHPSYGINIDPKPHHLAFKRAWWDVNRLAISAIPDHAKKVDAHFHTPPKEWYLKDMIQSE